MILSFPASAETSIISVDSGRWKFVIRRSIILNGTGLGLPIARGIIEAHHGSIAFLFPEETSDSKNTPDNPDKSGTLLNHMSGSHLQIVLPLC